MQYEYLRNLPFMPVNAERTQRGLLSSVAKLGRFKRHTSDCKLRDYLTRNEKSILKLFFFLFFLSRCTEIKTILYATRFSHKDSSKIRN